MAAHVRRVASFYAPIPLADALTVAEKTMLSLQSTAKQSPNINFIAISHSSPDSTSNWLASLPEHPALPNLSIVVDEERELYAAWGLGAASLWHVLNPFSMWNMVKMGRAEGIWNRPTETGTRWQTSGSWAVDEKGFVRWGGASKEASDLPDFGAAVKALEKN